MTKSEIYGLTEAVALIHEIKKKTAGTAFPNGSGQVVIHIHSWKPKMMDYKIKGVDWRGMRR
ncbi:MAG: hypothetical protein ABIH23_16800 [bacterium]